MSGEFCAQCLSEQGPFLVRPYGKDDALVRICDRCENEHPRQGNYNYSEATRVVPRVRGHKTALRR